MIIQYFIGSSLNIGKDSNKNKEGYPRYEEFVGIQAVKEYIEEQFINEYL